MLAGVGNIYADEALFLAGVRPTRSAARVTRRECDAIARGLQQVLRALDRDGRLEHQRLRRARRPRRRVPGASAASTRAAASRAATCGDADRARRDRRAQQPLLPALPEVTAVLSLRELERAGCGILARDRRSAMPALAEVVQTDATSVALELYGAGRRRWLTLSCDPERSARRRAARGAGERRRAAAALRAVPARAPARRADLRGGAARWRAPARAARARRRSGPLAAARDLRSQEQSRRARRGRSRSR